MHILVVKHKQPESESTTGLLLCSKSAAYLQIPSPKPQAPHRSLSGSLSPLLQLLDLPEGLQMKCSMQKTCQMQIKVAPNSYIVRKKPNSVLKQEQLEGLAARL